MKTIVISCLKGGVGKSLHAAHLSVALGHYGSVVTMDLDPQGTHADWWNDRSEESPAFASIENHTQLAWKHAELAKHFAWCVIDTPPQVSDINRAAIKVADLVIIPCKHAKGDLKAVMPTVDLCEEEGKKFIFLLNETNGQAVAKDARDKLAEVGPVIPGHIPKLNLYWQALVPGKGITEVNQGTAAIQIEKMTQFIVGRMNRERAHV